MNKNESRSLAYALIALGQGLDGFVGTDIGWTREVKLIKKKAAPAKKKQRKAQRKARKRNK